MADRLDEIRARRDDRRAVQAAADDLLGMCSDRGYADAVAVLRDAAHTLAADVEWLLEHIEQQRVEVERLQEALNRRLSPVTSEWLTKLHDRAHQQPQSRVWRIVDTLVHQVDAEQLRATELRAQRQAVLDLCDARQRYVDEDEPDGLLVVWIREIRAALGAADERTATALTREEKP